MKGGKRTELSADGAKVYISDKLLCVVVICVTIILFLGNILLYRRISDMPWWGEVLISMLVSGAASVGVSIFIYYKYLKEIPEKTEERINSLLNSRLEYETSNHNAVIGKLDHDLNPRNSTLSHEHDEIKFVLSKINDFAVGEVVRRENATGMMSDKQTLISQSVDNLSAFSIVMKDVIVKNYELEQQNAELLSENVRLKEQIKKRTRSDRER